jgi:hypothetical protein
MSAFLEKLKHRPIPEKKIQHEIVVPVAAKRPDPSTSAIFQIGIFDKTKQSVIDRASIMNALLAKRVVSSSVKELDASEYKETLDDIQPPIQVKSSEQLPMRGKVDKRVTHHERSKDTETSRGVDTRRGMNVVEEKGNISTAPLVVVKKIQRRIKLVERPIDVQTPVTGILKIANENAEKVNAVPAPGADIAAVTKAIKKLRLPKKQQGVIASGPITMVKIGDELIKERLPKTIADKTAKETTIIAPSYYMNNREKFIDFINTLFKPYREQLLSSESDFSCDKGDTDDRTLLTHQRIVKDYLDIHTPYRGLMLYHGLGSGKTCGSIAIAEGLKTYKKIIVMTPASLRMNYMEELKKCGDLMYKKNQFWEFIDSRGNDELIATLSRILLISVDFIRRNGGAWLVNVKKPSNFEELTPAEKVTLDAQLNEMIRSKYQFINYNGLRSEHFKVMTNDYTQNPFDNSVIIVDEAHNFVSRIVNKIKRPGSLAMRMYEYLMNAQNMKVVLLTGTPIINYPNEIGVLFNILRGYIKTWNFPVTAAPSLPGNTKINIDLFKKIFGYGKSGGNGGKSGDLFDSIDYNSTTKVLSITRNPWGFINTYRYSSYKGVKNDAVKNDAVKNDAVTNNPVTNDGANIVDAAANEAGMMSDAQFEKMVVETLRLNKLEVSPSMIKQEKYKALPDKLEEFNSMFIGNDNLGFKNIELFMRRILGLTSYFRSAQEKLLPAYDFHTNFHVVESEMSDFQFNIYEKIRQIERKQEERARKNKSKGGVTASNTGEDANDLYKTQTSTYRIFSRASCNFVFPSGIKRPLPGDDDIKTVGDTKKDKGMDKGMDKGTDKDTDTDNNDPNVDSYINQIDKIISSEPTNDDATASGCVKPGNKGRKTRASIADQEEIDEDMLDGVGVEERLDNPDGLFDEDDREKLQCHLSTSGTKASINDIYQAKIKKALNDLKTSAMSYLTPEHLATYSPKLLRVLENLVDEKNIGLHLLYTQFRTLEGVGVIKIILETNGFAHFRIKQGTMGEWIVDMTDEERGKPCFALYTGTETPEEKEIIRNIFNSQWKYVPNTITADLQRMANNNMYGEIIKILMITASGAEGINLRNVRFVHIVEPYWHPVRTDQVIGRARRICSHKDLPEELRTVDVFMYLMKFSEKQISPESDQSLELRLKDVSKIDHRTPLTTDQSLYEISRIKEDINKQILSAVKSSSFDCGLHTRAGSKENVKCFTFGDVSETKYVYSPNIANQESDVTAAANREKKQVNAVLVTIGGVKYAMDKTNNNLYDFENYQSGNIILIGKLVMNPSGENGEPGGYKIVQE